MKFSYCNQQLKIVCHHFLVSIQNVFITRGLLPYANELLTFPVYLASPCFLDRIFGFRCSIYPTFVFLPTFLWPLNYKLRLLPLVSSNFSFLTMHDVTRLTQVVLRSQVKCLMQIIFRSCRSMTIKLQNYATVVFFGSTNISASFMTTVTQKNVFIISLS